MTMYFGWKSVGSAIGYAMWPMLLLLVPRSLRQESEFASDLVYGFYGLSFCMPFFAAWLGLSRVLSHTEKQRPMVRPAITYSLLFVIMPSIVVWISFGFFIGAISFEHGVAQLWVNVFWVGLILFGLALIAVLAVLRLAHRRVRLGTAAKID